MKDIFIGIMMMVIAIVIIVMSIVFFYIFAPLVIGIMIASVIFILISNAIQKKRHNDRWKTFKKEFYD